MSRVENHFAQADAARGTPGQMLAHRRQDVPRQQQYGQAEKRQNGEGGAPAELPGDGQTNIDAHDTGDGKGGHDHAHGRRAARFGEEVADNRQHTGTHDPGETTGDRPAHQQNGVIRSDGAAGRCRWQSP